jgi:GDP-L-fucose synthase
VRVFVTGGSGFMGQHLIAALKARGDQVVAPTSLECDLRDLHSLASYSATADFDRIFHLAAWTQAGDFCLRHPGEQWVINQQINTNVLAWWWQSQPQAKLVCMGTSCAYAPDSRLVESNYLVGQPIDSLFTYAMTKRMLYVGLGSLHRQFGLRYLCLVPSTLYGPGYHTDGRQMHFIFDLIRKILRGRDFDEPVVLWGHGHQKRELVLADDFIRLALAIDERCENDLVNIGAGAEHSIRDFAAVICDIAGYDPSKIIYDESRYVGAQSKCLEIRKLSSIVGDPGFTDLREGLRRTIHWFESVKAY